MLPAAARGWLRRARARGGGTAAARRGAASGGDGLAWLAGLVNHEAAGMPQQEAPAAGGGAGAGSAGAPPGRFDLSRMRALLRELGDPHARVPVVHVAGTKGKGSVAAMLAAMLRAGGARVGVYSSPHLHSVCERIQGPEQPPADSAAAAGGPAPIGEAAFAELAARAAAAAARLPPGPPPTHFEALTAMAFAHFAAARADVAVVEAGMGGATDATNVCPPEAVAAAVVTQIGWDHVEALGGSLETIAAAKAGILRPGRPAVLAPQPHAAAAAVLAAAAAAVGAAAVDAGAAVTVDAAGPLLVDAGPGWQLACQEVDVAAPGGGGGGLALRGVRMRLVGAHQRANAATAVAAALALRAGAFDLRDAAIRAGLEAAALPARFQVVRLPPARGADAPQQGQQGQPQQQPYVVLDGAHTPEAAAALAAALREAFPAPAPLALVVAMAGDKALRETLTALRAAAPGAVVFTAAAVGGSTARSAPPGTLVQQWQAAAMLAPGRPFRCRELVQGGVNSALPRALKEVAALAAARQGGAGGGGAHPGVVCVTGSLHAAAAAERELQGMWANV